MKYKKEWTAGLMAGLISGAVAGWIWTTIGGWLVATKAKDWWDVVSAIATSAAVIVAVGNGWYIQRKEARVKEREGAIVAAQLSTSLPPLIRRLETAVSSFREARDGPHDGAWQQVFCVTKGFEHLKGLDLLVHLPDLSSLAWADGEAAHLIAKAIGSIRHIQAHPLGQISAEELAGGLAEKRYYRVARHATSAAEWLEEARAICSRLSEVKYRVHDEWRLPAQDVCGYVPDDD
jgi:hypothetical protein